MSLFPWFPFTNSHELNLDWILKKIRGYDDRIDEVNSRQDEIDEKLTQVEATILDTATEVVQDAIEDGAFNDSLETLVAPIRRNLNSAITQQDKRIKDVEDAFDDLSQEFDLLNYQVIHSPQNTNLIIISDSYGNNIGGTLSWNYRIENQHIFKSVTHLVRGGCGFTGKYSSGDVFPPQEANNNLKFLTLLENWVTSHTEAERKEIGAVLIAGGFNDVYSEVNEIRDAIAAFMSYAKQQLPNAVFYLAELGWCGFGTGSLENPTQRTGYLSLPSTSPVSKVLTSRIRRRIAQVVIPAYSGAGIYGLYYLGTAIGCIHNYLLDFLSDDGYHPSNNGHVSISKWIVNKMLGSGNFVPAYSSIDLLYNPDYQGSLPSESKPSGSVTIATGITTEKGIYINQSLEWYFTYIPDDNTGSQTSDFNNFMNIFGMRTNILPSEDLSFMCFIRGVFQGDTNNRSHLGIIRFYQGTNGGAWYTQNITQELDGRFGIAIFPMEGQTMIAGNRYNIRFISQFIPYEMC